MALSRIARARGLAQAIAEARDDARLDGVREGAAEIAELLDLPPMVGAAAEAVRAHRDGWVRINGDRAGNMRPADRELWMAVLGPEAGGS